MKKTLILGLVTLVCLAVTVALWFAVRDSRPDYEEVRATVISAESEKQYLGNGNTLTKYHIVCRYDGKLYELQNAHDTWSYPEGRPVTAFLSGDKLYANIEGVKNGSPVGIAYFVFLFGTMGLLGITLYVFSLESKRKKALRGQGQVPPAK